MKHSFISVISLASLALAACSNDELVNESTVDNNEIKFNVVSDLSSRAMDSYYYTSLLKPDAFYVCANIGDVDNAKYGKAYFALEKHELQAGSTFYTSSAGPRYWPTDGTKLNFFAHYNAYNRSGNEITPDLITPASGRQYYRINEFALPQSEHEQRDFVYAATLDHSRPADNTGKVNLNFKHALAQLAFRIECEEPSLIVLVDGLTIYNVVREGTMTFGQVSTNGSSDATTTCNWTVADLSSGMNTLAYDIDMNRGNSSANRYACSYVYYSNGVETPIVQDITPTVDGNGNTTGGLMVIPQEYEAWTPSTDASHQWQGIENEATTADGVRQTYIGLRCRIYHLKNYTENVVNSSSFFQFEGAKLKNTAAVAALNPELKYGGADGEFKEIVLPMPVMHVGYTTDTWQAGKKYVYTFKIGSGSNGGYDPGNGDPVLKAITFTGSIAGWGDETIQIIKE